MLNKIKELTKSNDLPVCHASSFNISEYVLLFHPLPIDIHQVIGI